MNKDSIYVLKQPKHSIVSIIVVEGDDLPLNKTVHDNIDKLSEISDIMFVFSNRFTNNLDIKKFSTLYNACSYIYGSSSVISYPLVESISYSLNIFKSHHVFLLTSIRKLSQVELGNLENIQELGAANIKRPIVQIQRLTTEELSEIYLLPEQRQWQKVLSRVKPTNINRINSTHRSQSSIMFIKAPTMKNIIEQIPKSYLDTFVEEDFSYMISSLIKKLEIREINSNVVDLKIGDLNGKGV